MQSPFKVAQLIFFPMGRARLHKLVKKFMFHHVKRVLVEEHHVGSKFPNPFLTKRKICQTSPPPSSPRSWVRTFCFLLLDFTYFTQATKCLPSVEVKLDLETTNSLLHQLH
jgi:hypothetical protein